jgi:hypothetical protein
MTTLNKFRKDTLGWLNEFQLGYFLGIGLGIISMHLYSELNLLLIGLIIAVILTTSLRGILRI